MTRPYLLTVHRTVAKMFQHRLLPGETPEQKNTQYDKENIREPDEQFGVGMRISSQRVANDYKQEVGGGNNQAHRESD